MDHLAPECLWVHTLVHWAGNGSALPSFFCHEPVAMAKDLLIRNVRRDGGMATDMLLRGGMIAAVGAGATSADAVVIDAGGSRT